ncbi:alpha/beta hydrolase [Shimia sp.]|uniref:alpha/beta hydrolase n=1 Tax=Shimia sp. TaxID=1954381 RepID=UPI00329731BA
MKNITLLPLILTMALTACGEKQYNEINIMPAPTVYSSGVLDPFGDRTARDIETQTKLFYATDRATATPDDASDFYANRRGVTLKVGTATVRMTPPAADETELRDLTTRSQTGKKRKLRVTGVQEIGPLPNNAPNPLIDQPAPQTLADTKRTFRNDINTQLARSGSRDAFIYIHGYNVDFEYPTLVSRELQHYLGYRGAFISYNWPATPSRLAYFKDLETADATRRNLRALIEFLSDETNVRRIHLIGYSAGSRLAFETVYQIALQRKAGHDRVRLGQVILIGSDLDRTYFTEAVADGLLNSLDHMSIYMSGDDSALAMSKIVFGKHRLGQIWETDERTAPYERRLAEIDKLSLIDVTDAEGAGIGNGHWYFRSSPWASSDIFLTLIDAQTPQNRGLVRRENSAVWTFPEDYPVRLQQLNR